MIFYHGELEKLVRTNMASTPQDETRPLTSTKRAEHKLNMGVFMFTSPKYDIDTTWG